MDECEFVTEFRELKELCVKWRCLSAPDALPPYEELCFGGLGRAADNLALAKRNADGLFQLLYGGEEILRLLGATAHSLLESLIPNRARALQDCLSHAEARREPAMTLARFVRGKDVATLEIAAFPVANRRVGGELFLVFVRERASKFDFVDAIYSAMCDGVITLAALYGSDASVVDFEIINFNNGATKFVELSAQNLGWRRLLEIVPTWRDNGIFERLCATIGRARREEFEACHQTSAGETVYLRVSAMPMGDLIGLILTDVTSLKAREASFRLLFEGSPVPMWVYDPRQRSFIAVNESATRHYGFSREEFLELALTDLYVEEEWIAVARSSSVSAKDFSSGKSCLNKTADGRLIRVQNYARELGFEGRDAILTAIVDITEQHDATARIAHLAHHDALTGLSNRLLFRERLFTELREASGREGGLAVLYIDLDDFKGVNDIFGHQIGDKLLVAVSERLRRALPEDAIAARFGGDEFAVATFNIANSGEVAQLAKRIIDTAAFAYEIDDNEIRLGMSVGVRLATGSDDDADTLLRDADIALYQAKREGRGTCRFFRPEMFESLQRRRRLEADLRKALEEGELQIYYQPIMDLEKNRVVAMEALLRWFHASEGCIGPDIFIPLAEETGLIVPIGDWVLRRACEEATSWPSTVSVCVNLSPAQFKSRSLLKSVVQALASSGLSPGRLDLEITESILLAENKANLDILRQLRDLGARISLDDFGTGYSSLSYLRSFPFDKIKIDRSFVKELPRNLECVAIVRALMSIANCLGISTVAEGVESPEQLAYLSEEGYTQMQGFLWGRPAPAADIRRFFENSSLRDEAA